MHRTFASGLRNPLGMAIEPETGALWVTVNERDELGNGLGPDYITSVEDSGFCGWPYSYFGQHVDERVKPRSGYNVIFVPFVDGKPSRMPIDVLTGFVQENGDAMGRPVGVEVDRRGGLLVADDVGNVVWRVAGAMATTSRCRYFVSGGPSTGRVSFARIW